MARNRISSFTTTLEFLGTKLAKEISPNKLTKWLYKETQEQKEAIREEIIRNLTRRKTKQTLLEAGVKKNTVQQYRKKAKWKSKTRLKTGRNKKRFKKGKEAPEQKKLEDKGAPLSNMSI
ncbi:33410_t:CDS:2 [Gigaspora margarita]|uniref:33410_t:CDS:1 n=1 Tax=Gigaspora margarita TaxID=4874 RepID=A0ABN7ULY5_GIGMA|nr:33410_t:CDS:2 [Gigaspora margarita]